MERRHVREDIGVLAQGAEFSIGKLSIIMRRVLPRGENVHHFRRPQRHDRPEQDRLNKGENGGVHSDRDSEGEDGDNRESRRLAELTKSETKIV